MDQRGIESPPSPRTTPYQLSRGDTYRRISLLPANVLQADLRPSSLNMNVNTYLFLFVRPKAACYCTRNKLGRTEKRHASTLTLPVRRKSACKTSAGSSKIFRWLAPLLGPNLDPKTGPTQRPKRRNENVIQFWTPFWGPYLDPKMGSAIGEFRCCRKCFASRFATQQLEHECQHIPFSLCASQGRLLLYKKQIGRTERKSMRLAGLLLFPLRKCIFSVAATFWVAKLDSLLLVFFLPRPVFFLPRTGFFPPRTVFSRCLQNAFFLLQRCFCAAARCFFCCFEFFPLRCGIFCWRFFPLRKQLFPAARRFFPAAKRVFSRSDVFFLLRTCVFRALREDKELENVSDVFFLLRTCVFRALREDKELENVESYTGRSALVSWIAHGQIGR